MRSRENKATFYLRPMNLSEGGILAFAEKAFAIPVEVGQQVEVQLFGKGFSFTSEATVVRISLEESLGPSLAMRFVALPPEARESLSDIIVRLAP